MRDLSPGSQVRAIDLGQAGDVNRFVRVSLVVAVVVAALGAFAAGAWIASPRGAPSGPVKTIDLDHLPASVGGAEGDGENGGDATTAPSVVGPPVTEIPPPTAPPPSVAPAPTPTAPPAPTIPIRPPAPPDDDRDDDDWDDDDDDDWDDDDDRDDD